MGNWIRRALDALGDHKAKILILGLDAAGKTTILYKAKLNETVCSTPTIGFNVEQLKYKGLEFTVWDIGAQSRIMQLWHHYYEGTDALVFVVDASDTERLSLAKETLDKVISNDSLTTVPVLVFANKMDIAALSAPEILKAMGLHQMKREWKLQPTCALNGEGIAEGFTWLTEALAKKRKDKK